MIAVTFDYGYTLAKIDFEMMAARVREHGYTLDAQRAEAGLLNAWNAYEVAKATGHENAWLEMMKTFLLEGGLNGPLRDDGQHPADAMALWLWEQQPTKNLWRSPIPGMFELVADLKARGIPVGIISNSEGRLAELVAELDKSALFPVIADSGRLGIDKPHPQIFEYTARALGVTTSQLIHVGDSWQADVVGALGVGARAIWFSFLPARLMPDGVVRCENAEELRRALKAWGVEF